MAGIRNLKRWLHFQHKVLAGDLSICHQTLYHYQVAAGLVAGVKIQGFGRSAGQGNIWVPVEQIAQVGQAALGGGGRVVARGVELALALHAFVAFHQHPRVELKAFQVALV